MKILLTGSTGFIGSAFARAALTNHDIAGLVIPSEPVPQASRSSITWLRGTLDEAPWNDIRRFKPDVCVHTAWITTPGAYLESPENERFRDSSLRFLRGVSEAGARHIVSLGTCVEYQIRPEPLSEEHTPAAPTTTYARSKNELRIALEAEAKQRGFTACWARVFYPYGPGEHPSRLCSSIVQKLSRGEPVVLKTPDSTKDYIYIEDVASALLTVVEQRASGIVNLGTGIGTTVRQIADQIGKILAKPELIQAASRPDHDPFPFVVADAAKLKALGWRQSWSLERGLEQLCLTARR